jgi:hypothetical protein
VPRLCEFYPGICLTTEEKARKNHSQGNRRVLVYILSKHPHITKPTHTHTHIHYKTYTHTHTHIKNPHTHTHTLKNNIKPPQYKLKQTQYKIYPNEIVSIQSSTLSIRSPYCT